MTVTVDDGEVQGPSPAWRIDELAALVGVPTRTIREYQTLGLLAPPRRQGRVGWYDEGHRRRLELISRLQQRGYSLAGIRDLVKAWNQGRSLDELVGDGLSTDEAGLVLDREQLEQFLPALAEPALLAAAERSGLVRPCGEGRWCVRSPALLGLVADAAAGGAELESALRVAARLRDGARLQAAAIGDLVEELWPAVDHDAMVARARRGRLLLARAAGTLLIDELGFELAGRATRTGGDGLDALVERLRIGAGRDGVD